MQRRAGGKPIRVASKSLRCRPLLRTILERDTGYRGLLNYTLAEALWLAAEGFGDLVVAYPTTDRRALRELAALSASMPHSGPVLMVDCVENLDLIQAAVGRISGPLRVCIDFDASFWFARDRLKIGPKRTPITPRRRRVSWPRRSLTDRF